MVSLSPQSGRTRRASGVGRSNPSDNVRKCERAAQHPFVVIGRRAGRGEGEPRFGAATSSQQRTSEADMTSSLLIYIMTIGSLEKERGSVRSADVAEKLGVARASVCRAADRLAEGGWAARGEGSRLHLTEKGRKVVETYAPALGRMRRQFASEFGLTAAKAEREALAALGALEEDTVERIARKERAEEREKCH